jgi:hypothetical protein
VRLSRLARESDLQHGCDERGGNAMSRNVCDQDAHTSFIDAKEIVEVAGNGTQVRGQSA